jgi:hemerythrin
MRAEGEVVVEFRAAIGQSVIPLRVFLTEWLTQHEFGLDRKLADFIRSTASAR